MASRKEGENNGHVLEAERRIRSLPGNVVLLFNGRTLCFNLSAIEAFEGF